MEKKDDKIKKKYFILSPTKTIVSLSVQSYTSSQILIVVRIQTIIRINLLSRTRYYNWNGNTVIKCWVCGPYKPGAGGRPRYQTRVIHFVLLPHESRDNRPKQKSSWCVILRTLSCTARMKNEIVSLSTQVNYSCFFVFCYQCFIHCYAILAVGQTVCVCVCLLRDMMIQNAEIGLISISVQSFVDRN